MKGTRWISAGTGAGTDGGGGDGGGSGTTGRQAVSTYNSRYFATAGMVDLQAIHGLIYTT